jgi:hypothetical protein
MRKRRTNSYAGPTITAPNLDSTSTNVEIIDRRRQTISAAFLSRDY